MTYSYQFKPNTLSQNSLSFADMLPEGRVWDNSRKSGTVQNKVLNGLSYEMGRFQALTYQLVTSSIPNLSNSLIEQWEAVLGIPDDCFPIADTDQERRLNIVVKLAYLNLQTEDDYIELANILGLSITISNAYPVMTIDIEGFVPPTFPYTFPFVFGADSNNLFQCLVLKQKPAHIEVVFI